MATLSYVPRGFDGFRCTLQTRDGRTLVVETVDGKPQEPSGDEFLFDNEALVASVLGYAESELAFRRSRHEERKESLRKQVNRFERDAKIIAEYLCLPGGDSAQGWCSSCFQETTHRRVLGTRQPVPVHLCRSCGSPNTPCAAPRCPHFAHRGSRSWSTPKYCAEHRHEIPSFVASGQRLDDLAQAKEWMRFSKTNFSRATKIAGLAVGAGAVVGPFALMAAPAIGGAIGVTTGLSGAAATSHGLALLGGGSLAAGGFGMAGGTAVVTAAGSALGGVLGAATAAAYARADKSFDIEHLKLGDGPPIVISSGFLTDGKRGWGPWRSIIEDAYPDSPVYRVHWGAKELRAFASLAAAGGGKQFSMAALRKIATRAMKVAGKKLGPVGLALTAQDLATNPWTVARTRATMTGAILADLLARTDGQPFVLVGHSLGGRVMAEAAITLGTRTGQPVLLDLHLLGSAIGHKKEWRLAAQSVRGTIYNYHSRNDNVLKVMYQLAELGSKPIGLSKIPNVAPNIKNRDVSRSVKSHSDYFAGVRLSVDGQT